MFALPFSQVAPFFQNLLLKPKIEKTLGVTIKIIGASKQE